MSAQKWWCRWC